MSNARKCLVAAIIGAPNAGKSTLLNRLIGQKISIVTPKVQTTRVQISGIVTEAETQLVFIDTPGIFSPQKRFQDAMVRNAWGSINQANTVILLVDASKGINEITEHIISQMVKRKIEPVLALNKIDKLDKSQLLPLVDKFSQRIKCKNIFMISALQGDGIKDLKHYLIEKAPEEEWLYPEDQISNMPMKIIAAEETREQLFMAMQQEVPYGIVVETEGWKETEKQITINQVIYVDKKGHKNMVIGKSGSTIKQIGEKTRKSLERMLGKKVNLFLFVKHKENWQDDPQIYKTLGLDFPED